MENNNEVKYAGFWVRVLAWIIDALIVGIPMKMLEAILDIDSGITIVLSLILLWLYYGYAVYRWRGTIGKRVLGLEVLNYDLTSVTLQKASLRFLYSLITYTIVFAPLNMLVVLAFVYSSLIYGLYIILLLPILMILITDKKQVLHDYFAKTIVVDVSSMLKNTPRGTSIEEVTLKNDVDIEDTKYQENE
ncbi:MAG: RDD family protein [Epsilonproteobacteria bacterium]|nr:RDD family protein [Campylobacterota bacterium]